MNFSSSQNEQANIKKAEDSDAAHCIYFRSLLYFVNTILENARACESMRQAWRYMLGTAGKLSLQKNND